MTRRKTDKVRDKDATINQMIKAVGEIMATAGFSQLDASKIMRWIDKSPRLVSKYFYNLNGLLKRYIEERDYWRSFFDRFELPVSASDDRIRETFIEVMQQNLKHFSGDAEMQNVILWQISEVNALMRAVSDAREAEGAKLLALTDPYFAGTEVNFRAVIALLLYGSYAMVLHARYNKSTVCGIDINIDRDWWMVHRTLTQIINWAWEAATNKPTTKKTMMNYEFEYLETLAEEQLTLRGAADLDTEPSDKLVKEVHKLKRKMMSHLMSLDSETQTRTYLQINLHSLVAICDVLYDPAKQYNPDAELILGMIEAIRRNMNSSIPGNLGIPKIFRDKENIKFQQAWKRIQGKMIDLGIAEELQVLVSIPFANFAENTNGLEWSDFKYLRKFERRMSLELNAAGMNQQELLHTMIGLGFNDAKFVRYCHRLIAERIAEQDDGDKVRLLKRYRGTIRQLIEYTNMRFDHYKKPVVEELIKWAEAELEFIY
ncbi:hypothetical protein ACXZ1K_01005 [Pedobacter sp. PWIIR3]